MGALVGTDNVEILYVTSWGYAYTVNETAHLGTEYFMGLNAYVVRKCHYGDRCADCWGATHFGAGCNEGHDSGRWSDLESECKGHQEFHESGFPCKMLEQCARISVNNQFSFAVTCITLVFALMGVTTRIRKNADSNFQKVIGCIPDTIGVITLIQSLWLFKTECHDDAPAAVNGLKAVYWPGPGWTCYFFCWTFAVIRVSIHWLTPVPFGGMAPLALVKSAMTGTKEIGARLSRRLTSKSPVAPRRTPQAPEDQGLPAACIPEATGQEQEQEQ